MTMCFLQRKHGALSFYTYMHFALRAPKELRYGYAKNSVILL